MFTRYCGINLFLLSSFKGFDEDAMERLEVAAASVRDGRSMTVGEVLLGSEDADTLSITGWTRSASIERLSRQTALSELNEVKSIYKEKLKTCPDLPQMAGKKSVRFCLGFDYGMGAIRICSEIDGRLTWEAELGQ